MQAQGFQGRGRTLILVSTTWRTPGEAAWCSHCALRTLLARVMMGENRWLNPLPLQDRLQPCARCIELSNCRVIAQFMAHRL